MTAVTVTDRSALASALRNLKLSGMLATLDARLAQARAGELGHLDFLQVLCQDEVSRRESMSLARRIRRARFETEATLEGFDFTASPKLPAATIRDLAAHRATLLQGPRFVGTATAVADQMEEWFNSGGCDGFVLAATHLPGAFEEFVRMVVPVLQQRGLFRREYAGPTLREHLGIARPESQQPH